MNDIKVPPFTDGQKQIIEMTEKLAEKRGGKICDVDDDITDIRECERCEELPKCETGKNESVICCTEYKPKQPITNGDYLRICSTDSLAEFLWQYTHDLIYDWERIGDPMFRFRHMPLKNILGDNCTKKEAWVEWLKQPHTPIS